MTDGESAVPARPAALRRVLIALCVTEIASWGVLYYAFPVMVSVVARDTGWSVAVAMGAFSTGAVVAAVAGVFVGRVIDSRGPRPVMTAGSVLAVAGVLAIASAPNLVLFYGAWGLAGLAQSAVLYVPAFAAITGWYGPDRVKALTILTLSGGFASTVFAPLTAALLDAWGWRSTFVVLAVILGVVTIPLHWWCLTIPWPRQRHHTADVATQQHPRAVVRSQRFILLVVAMTLTAFGLYAATVNLVPLLVGRGVNLHLAALALGLVGVGQVMGRICYAPFLTRMSLRTRTAVVLATGGMGVAVLGLLSGPVAILIGVAVLAGAARGIYTLLQATAVSDRWGTTAFGQINGVFSAPMTAVIALAPAGGALLADMVGSYPHAFLLLALVTFVASALAFTGDSGRLREPSATPQGLDTLPR